MGPTILFDKSALQSLSQEDVRSLHLYYYVVIAPVLIAEILGDFKKKEDPADALKEVRKLTTKMTPTDSLVTVHFTALLVANLLGNPVEMEGRPIRGEGRTVTLPDGTTGMYYDEQPEREALRRWDTGRLTEAEEILADRWRQTTKSLDLEAWQKAYKDFPKCRNWDDLQASTDKIARDPSRQLENLQWLMLSVELPEHTRTEVFNRWVARGMPLIADYAPYADFCMRVFIAFHLGLANRLITTRATNRVDLEYLLYLPFCLVFASSDNLHRDLAPQFLRDDQRFVLGTELKADLDAIQAFLGTMSKAERKEYRRKHGTYPPDIAGSFTNAMWAKHCTPRSEYKPGKPVSDWTDEEHEAAMERLRPFINAIEEDERRRGRGPNQ